MTNQQPKKSTPRKVVAKKATPKIKEVIQPKIIFDKQNLDEKLASFTDANTFVVADFSKTFSDFLGPSTWSAISKSGAMPTEYVKERQELYDEYHPFEIDESLDLKTKNKKLCVWWKKHAQLLVNYGLNERVFEICVENGLVKLRDGLKDFLHGFKERGVPVIILSSGIGRFVQKALKVAGCENFDNIYIIANNLEFACCTAVKAHGPFIHPYNKQSIKLLKFKGRTNMILFGDDPKDIVKPKHVLNSVHIGFLEKREMLDEYKKHFDIVCIGDTNFTELMEKVKL